MIKFIFRLKVDPLFMRNDDDIKKQQKRLEGATAPLGESSENSQLLQKLLYENYKGKNALTTCTFLHSVLA